MITVPIRDRLRSEDERLFIASLELGHQQVKNIHVHNLKKHNGRVVAWRFRYGI